MLFTEEQLEKIPLVHYTKGEEILNTITHAAGLLLSAAILHFCVAPSVRAGDGMRIVCSLLFCLGTTLTFVISALYHGFRPGNAKRILRLTDHCAIFFAVAGTATGCVPAVYDTVGLLPSVVMIVAGWLGAILGLILTLRDFEGTRTAQMTIYIATAFVCAVSGGGAYKHLPKGAFYALLSGSALLLIGAVLCGIGKKKRYIHSIFHLFIDGGLLIYFLGISKYCY